MTEPVWLTADLVIAFHDEQLRRFGGPAGIRDRGMLEAALDRPRNKYTYGEKDMAALAAAYAFGMVRNHPFVDGNKRASFLAMVVFLGLNGIQFRAPEPEAAAAVIALAAGDLSEAALTQWVRDRAQ